jgi:hypothetical protein
VMCSSFLILTIEKFTTGRSRKKLTQAKFYTVVTVPDTL